MGSTLVTGLRSEKSQTFQSKGQGSNGTFSAPITNSKEKLCNVNLKPDTISLISYSFQRFNMTALSAPQIVKVLDPSHLIVRRVAFDIGSSTTKMQVSDVDTTNGKITNVLLSDGVRVALREDLVKNSDVRFSPVMENKLVDAIKELISRSKPFNPQAYHAVATESLRLAENGLALIERIKTETGLTITIISQEEEGVLGFISATNEKNVNPEKVISWDFGGGSFQLTTKCGDQYFVYKKQIGKIPFRNALLHIQGKDVNQTLSPHPVSKSDFNQGLQYISENVKDLPVEISRKLSQPDVVLLGIGINALWGFEIYDQQQVLKQIEERLGLDDYAIMKKNSIEEARKDFTPYVVSNLILTYGIMKTLGIKSVVYVGTPAANAIGTLLLPKYWKEKSFIHSTPTNPFYTNRLLDLQHSSAK